MQGKDLIKLYLDNAPELPGVYRMISADNKILYIGKKNNILLGTKIAIEEYCKSCQCVFKIHKINKISNVITKIYQILFKPYFRLIRDIIYAIKNSTNTLENKYDNTVLFFPIWYNRIRLIKSVLYELNKSFNVKLILNN